MKKPASDAVTKEGEYLRLSNVRMSGYDLYDVWAEVVSTKGENVKLRYILSENSHFDIAKSYISMYVVGGYQSTWRAA